MNTQPIVSSNGATVAFDPPKRRFTSLMPSKAIKLPWIIGYTVEEIAQAEAEGKELEQPAFYFSLEQLLTFDEFLLDDMADLIKIEEELAAERAHCEREFKERWADHDRRKRGITASDMDTLHTVASFMGRRGPNGQIRAARDILTDIRLYLGTAELSAPPTEYEEAQFQAAKAEMTEKLEAISEARAAWSKEWDHRVLLKTLAYIKWPFDGPAPNPRDPESFYSVMGEELGATVIAWLTNPDEGGIAIAREQILGPLSRQPRRRS